MALKLVRRKGSDFWYVRGVFHGHKVNKSTETRDRGIAAKRLREMESAIIGNGPAAQRDAFTFEKAADLYLDHHPRSETDKRAIARLVDELGQTPLDLIKPHIIASAAIKLYPNGSAATRNRMAIMNASAILHYAAEQDLCGYLKIRRFKEEPVAPRDVGTDVARALLGTAEGPQRLLILFLFRQGWRISEALRIEWPHLDLAAKAVAHFNKKAGAWNAVPLHDEVAAALAELPDEQRTGKLFPWADRWEVYEWLWPLRDKLGVHFTPHMARHTFATQLAAGGASEFDLLATRNWNDLKSVKRYTRLNTDRARTVINRLKG